MAALLISGCASEGHKELANVGGVATNLYPRQICLVTDRPFKHGQPYTFVYQGQEVKLCCKDCFDSFLREPKRYLDRLIQAK